MITYYFPGLKNNLLFFWTKKQPNIFLGLKNNLLFSGLDSNFLQFYFLHSYYFDTKEKEDILATTHYGIDFASVVSHQDIYGVQFHPEKSHKWGEQLLKNFSKIKNATL